MACCPCSRRRAPRDVGRSAAPNFAGQRVLTAAVKTYEAEVGRILGGVLSPEEQHMSDYVSRLLTSIDQGDRT